MKVLNGTGKPRIVDSISTSTTKTISDVSVSGLVITLSSTSGVLDKYLKTKNAADDDIYAKAISIDGDDVTVDAWYDGIHSESQIPVTGTLYVLGTIYDLPYAQILDEGFTEDVRFKKLKQGGVIKKDVKGFYYEANLNYDKIATTEIYNIVATLLNLKDSFVLIPRRDQPLAAYSVHFTQGFKMKFRQKAFHQGNQGLTMELTGAERLDTVTLPTVSE